MGNKAGSSQGWGWGGTETSVPAEDRCPMDGTQGRTQAEALPSPHHPERAPTVPAEPSQPRKCAETNLSWVTWGTGS